MSFFSELKRRNVFRVAALYGVASWLLLQMGDLLFGALGVPAWGIRLLLGMLLLGFPLALIFAWVFELTPDGLKPERDVPQDASITAHTARKINLLIVVLLVAAIGLVAADRLFDRRGTAPQSAVASAASPAPGSATGSQPAAADVSIAVLPFVNMSEDKANEYFSDGLTEELLNVLANVEGLRVIARTSSFSYKGKEVKISDVARDLNVDNVLEGSVRKSNGKVRITTQLIRAADSSHLWSETYDRNADDIFAVQDEISRQVVDALKVRLLRVAPLSTGIGGTKIAAAYDAYLRGRFLKNQGETAANLASALASFDEAIRLDPGFALAYVGRSTTLWRQGSNGYARTDIAFQAAREAAQKAIDLAPGLAEGYLSLTLPKIVVDMDLNAAADLAEKAVHLNPGSFDVLYEYSGFLAGLGRHDEAVAAAEKVVGLDPLSPVAYANLAGIYEYARRYDDSLTAAQRTLALDPLRSSTHALIGRALLGLGHPDEALVNFNKESVQWQRGTGRSIALARLGKADAARAEMTRLRELMHDDASYQYAEINAQLGDLDEAFRWLDTARRVHDPGLMTGIYADPMLDPLRADPRYAKLIAELGFQTPN